MRRLLILALSSLLVAPTVLAANEPSAFKMQLAQKMYDLSGVDNVFRSIENEIGSNVMDGISQGLGNKAGCAALQPELKSFHDKMDGLFTGLNDKQFRNDAAKVYADTFSEDELRQIIAFQQSPAGQKLSKVSSDIGKRIYLLAMAKAKTREAEIKNTESAFVGNIQKIAETCPVTPPAAPPAPPAK